MKIIADENIPFIAEAFATVGEVTLVNGRKITPQLLNDATALVVRSVTQVNAALLEDSAVKWVGTATIGMDHLDLDYLQSCGVGFANASGSNANSVAEYVMTALVTLANRFALPLENRVLGVVGVGHIGSKVVRMAQGLGMTVLQNDPPLARQTGAPHFLPLTKILDADFITLHTPLTRTGLDRTWHLFDHARLRQMKPGSILLNTSRGPVVDNLALGQVLNEGRLKAAVLDVWETEPEIDATLLSLAALGTPHIAGYSFDGKVNGAWQIYRAFCDYFQLPPKWDPRPQLPKPAAATIQLPEPPDSTLVVLQAIMPRAYPIEADDQNLRKLPALPRPQQGAYFDQLRKEYPIRREFFNYQVILTPAQAELQLPLQALGFQVKCTKNSACGRVGEGASGRVGAGESGRVGVGESGSD